MPDISVAEERKEEDDPFAEAFNQFNGLKDQAE